MGWFKHFKPSIKDLMEEDKVGKTTDLDSNSESSIECQKPNEDRGNLIDGVVMVGLDAQMRKADEYIEYSRLSGKPRPIIIVGGRGSGKSTLAKEIMQRNRIQYKRIFLNRFMTIDEFLLVLEFLNPVYSGLILEGADEITDWDIIDIINKLITSAEVTFYSGRKLILSRMTLILPIRRMCSRIIKIQNLNRINISYKRDDYVRLYLRFCKEAGYDMPENKVHIDNKAIAFMGNIFNNNIVYFRLWAYKLMQLGDKEGKVVINMGNIIDFAPQMLDFEHLYMDEAFSSGLND